MENISFLYSVTNFLLPWILLAPCFIQLHGLWSLSRLNHLTLLLLCEWRRQWQPTPVLSPGKSHGQRSLVGCSPWVPRSRTRLSDFTFTFHFQALEKEMAAHFSVLAWRIPGTGEPGGLPSVGSHRVEHDWSNLAARANIHVCSGLSFQILGFAWCTYSTISPE